MARATKLADIRQWHAELKQLKETGRCRPPGFFMPYHFATMALLLKEYQVGELQLPPSITEYAAKLRLWEAIGLDSPVVVPPNPGGSRYHELTPLKSLADVENVAEGLANMLTSHSQRCSDQTRGNLFIMLAELVGNCHHHARADDGLHGLACAQTWYKDSRAQFAIADSGIGIRASLGENPDLARRLAAQNACELATEYGISSKLGRGHAGYGLTLARDLAAQTPGSTLFVQSCGEAILVEGQKVTSISDFDYAIPGTLVLFEWDMGKTLDLEDVYRNWPDAESDQHDYF